MFFRQTFANKMKAGLKALKMMFSDRHVGNLIHVRRAEYSAEGRQQHQPVGCP